MQGISGDRVLLPTSVACKITGLSRRYIQHLTRSGRIEGVKLGHDWLVYEDSLKDFVAQPRTKGRPKGSLKHISLEKKSDSEKKEVPSPNSENSVQEKNTEKN